MATYISSTDLARSLSDVLNRVRYRGEEFLVERNGDVIAALAPAPGTLGSTPRELASRLQDLRMPDDDFAADLEQIRASQGRLPQNPWDS